MDVVHPFVPEIVAVYSMVVAAREVVRNRELPTGFPRPVVKLIARDTDPVTSPGGRIEDFKLMQVVVEPAHGVLDGNMKIPKGVDSWHLNSTPDGRLDLV